MTDGQRLRGERLQIMLTADELSMVDDFRFKRRMPSRACCRSCLNAACPFVAGLILCPATDVGCCYQTFVEPSWRRHKAMSYRQMHLVCVRVCAL